MADKTAMRADLPQFSSEPAPLGFHFVKPLFLGSGKLGDCKVWDGFTDCVRFRQWARMAVLGIGVSCVASVANAQGMPVPSQARPEFRDARPIAQPNPFDVAQEIMQAAPAKTGKTVQKQMRMRSFTKVAPKLKFHQRYALDKARQQAIYNELVRRFG
ncbi:MAG TPA: hypothetical protein ENJ57_02005, partial [Rhizobiales bacterium]|nr:hypothetical protein [Hyphomicrobiales bacterium]